MGLTAPKGRSDERCLVVQTFSRRPHCHTNALNTSNLHQFLPLHRLHHHHHHRRRNRCFCAANAVSARDLILPANAAFTRMQRCSGRTDYHVRRHRHHHRVLPPSAPPPPPPPTATLAVDLADIAMAAKSRSHANTTATEISWRSAQA